MISVFGCDAGKSEIDGAAAAIESGWLGCGKCVEVFERAFAARRGLPNFLMVDNCSNALYMAVRLLGLPPFSRIAVPSLAWAACAQAIILAGYRPVFVDVDYDTMNVTAKTVEAAHAFGAVMLIHYAGLPVDHLADIVSLGVPVIEDCAHAPFSDYNGQSCGSIGAIGCYSFDPVKNIASCDGGGMTFQDPDMYTRAKAMRYCGIGKSGFEASGGAQSRWWEYDISDVNIRMLPNNVSASIAGVQLQRSEHLQAKRKRYWLMYQKAFGPFSRIKTPVNGVSHSYFTYCIRVPNRDALARYLYSHGVYTTLRFHPLHLNPIYGQTQLRLPNTEQLNHEALNLPLHPRLTDSDVTKIIELVIDFYKEH